VLDGSASADGSPDSGLNGQLPDAGSADSAADVPAYTYEGCTDPRRPDVTITAPEAAEDPTVDTVVTAERLEISCRITASNHAEAGLVDPSSVAITVLDVDRIEQGRPAVSVGNGGEYVATMPLNEMPSGPVIVQCYATDDSTPARCSLAEVTTLIDRGPVITVTNPEPNSIHSWSMGLRYSVEPSLLGANDPGAAVVEHSVVAAGVQLETEEGDPHQFAANVDFEDRSVFPEPLSGQYQLIIRAVNARGVEQVWTQDFTIDGDGPRISISTPNNGELVGGLFVVRAEVTDPAGVDASTVFLRVGTEQYLMAPISHGSHVYSRTFDASGFPHTVVEITLNVTASDTVGNGTAVSRTVKLDSVPPLVSLDPPYVREAREKSGLIECSELFDPVGEDSVHDGQTVGTAAEFRGRVEDLSNSTLSHSGTVIFMSEVNESAVDLYILDNTDVPLVVDTNDDGVCDEINPDVDPAGGSADAAIIIEMSAISAAGSAFWEPMAEAPTDFPFTWCDRGGTATKRPDPLCEESSPLTRVTTSSYSRSTKTIFAKPPIVRGETCVGDAWDFQASIDEGWACVALRAEDNLGNVGLAHPLRVCFMDGDEPHPCPVALGHIAPEEDRPDCTDGCTLPPNFTDYSWLNYIYPD
jgi:hypothetical protein